MIDDVFVIEDERTAPIFTLQNPAASDEI